MAASGMLMLILFFVSQSTVQECNAEKLKPTVSILQKWTDAISEQLTAMLNQTSGISILRNSYSEGRGTRMLPFDGSDLVSKMSQQIYEVLSKKLIALKKLVNAAETLVNKHDYDLNLKKGDVEWVNTKTLTEHDPRLEYNESFQQPVNFQYSSVHIPVEVYEGYTEVLNGLKWSSKLDEVFKKNLEEDPSLLWQYFGSQVGFMRTYPAMKWNVNPDIPDMFDVRRRSWYIHGSSSPKDMIILVDTSGSVHGQTLEIMKIAVKTLLHTLGENDFVNVATFSEKARWISCFDTLVQANKWNKKILSDALDHVTDGGIADFDAGLEFAFLQLQKFDMLKESYEGAECHKAIMLFTDGGMQKPNNTINKWNKEKKVRIFTYSVSPQALPFSGVKWIACKTRGFFSSIIGIGAVRENVQRYVNVLSRPAALSQDRLKPVWVGSYPDVAGLGMLTTVTHPVYSTADSNNQTLVGVMGVDASIAEMLRFIPKKQIGPLGYSFAVNLNGFVVFHPALKPEYEYLEEPPDIDVLNLEDKSTELQKIRRDMIDRKRGSVTVHALRRLPSRHHMSRTEVKYFYTPIGDTTFSLAIVIPTSRTHWLKVEGYQLFTNKAVIAEGSLIIAPWHSCAVNTKNTTTEEILRTFHSLVSSSDDACDKDIVSHLLWDVEKTQDVYEYWTKLHNASVILCRFVGTEGGITRVHPISQRKLMVRYDKIWKMAYFEKALVADKNVWNFMTSPDDGRSDKLLLTVSRSVDVEYSGRPYSPAVVGIKMYSTYLHSLMMNAGIASKETEQSFVTCNDIDTVVCYILDNAGFIIAANQPTENKVGIHIEDADNDLYYLLKNDTYNRTEHYDFQDICRDVIVKKPSAASPRLSNLFFDMLKAVDLSWTIGSSLWPSTIMKYISSLLSLSRLHQASGDQVQSIKIRVQKTESFHRCITKSLRYMYIDGLQDVEVENDQQIRNCSRWFMISKIDNTNLVFVMADHPCPFYERQSLDNVESGEEDKYSQESASFERRRYLKTPHHRPVEIPLDPEYCEMKLEYRKRPEQCFSHDEREDSSHCSCSTLTASVFLVTAMTFLRLTSAS